MSEKPIRFGIWAVVHGNRAALQDPDEPYDASWERNRDLILEAEALGYSSTLIAQHIINPHAPDFDQLETWTSAAAIAALTSKIEIIAAIKPGLFHPVVLAKMALQIEHIAQGRLGLNLINGWNRAEFEKAGIAFNEHDERYAYGREWISVVEPLLRGQSVSHRGENFQLDGYQLRPSDPYRARPLIYVGGESQPAQELAATYGDVYFINGQPIADVEALMHSVRSYPRNGPPLRFGLSAFPIARKTDDEAQAEYQRLLALAAKDAPLRAIQAANTDPKVIMKQTMSKSPRVGTNGGTAAGLVGSYETVAQRIRAFQEIGIEVFMLQFQPFEAEMRRFAEEVMPRVSD